jgi:hypothetical protein
MPPVPTRQSTDFKLMKHTTNYTIRILALASLLLLPSTAQCFYNPSTGRWISRDPIGEKGGFSLYAFGQNDPQDQVDALGLVAARSGSHSCRRCRVNSMNLVPGAWHYKSGYGSLYFTFSINATLSDELRLGDRDAPSCCKYIQWMTAYGLWNGRLITAGMGGFPMSDGEAHLDYRPWAGDDINKSIASGTWPQPSGTSYTASDNPGFQGGLTPGDQITLIFDVLGQIVDACNDNAVRASASLHASASGTYPNALSLDPASTSWWPPW